jgi:hypothetical protein
LVLGVKLLYEELRPRWWKKISGTIVKSEIKHETANSGRYQQYLPIIEYTYASRNATFRKTANLYSPGTLDGAISKTAQYPVEASVTIMVNPQNPHQSALETKVTPASCFFIVSGLLFTALELLFRAELLNFFV